MKKRTLLCIHVPVLFLAFLLLQALPAMAQQGRAPAPFTFQYAVKFLCTAHVPGTSQANPAFLPGSYQTIVNIHNPSGRLARIRVKVAPTLGEPSKFFQQSLKPDFTSSADCTELESKFGLLPLHGLEGFLVVESTLSLDVTAVHMAGKLGEGVDSIAVEQARERELR